MDNCTPLLETATTTATIDQENNQLLLNAIKCKFAAKTASEAASYSPPKFTIPTLKTLEDGDNTKVVPIVASATNDEDNGHNQLNTFLLKQLQNKQKSNDTSRSTGFEVPQLQFGTEVAHCPRFEIPLLTSIQSAQSSSYGVSSLTTAINQLKVQENSNPLTSCADHHPAPSLDAIDLTSALSSKALGHSGTPPTRDLKSKLKQSTTTEDFEIPFIDCDRLDNATSKLGHLVIENEYCLLDVSQSIFKPSYKQEPSAVGQFLHLVQKRYTPIPQRHVTSAQYQMKVKHNIKPFRFDTKSPDDKVTESMRKYSRR